MYLHITYSALESCKNLESSYGEICVKCNKCGRFDKDKKLRYVEKMRIN